MAMRTSFHRKLAYLGLFSLIISVSIGLSIVSAGPKFTSDKWGDQVGFKPDFSKGAVADGKKIKKGNYRGMDGYIAPALKLLIDKYNLTMKVNAYKPIHPSEGYIEATNKYYGQPKLIDIGDSIRKRGLADYTAGLPFPQPKNGLEIAWDFIYGYNGDTGDNLYGVYWISASGGVEHHEEWRWAFIMRTMYRTDMDPKPHLEHFAKKQEQYTAITYALSPLDKRGFGAVYSRAVEPRDQQGVIYVPQMRRILKNTFGTRGDTWNSTDLLYEDVRGYLGYPEWMNWKLVKKDTMLMPMHAGVKLGKEHIEDTYDFKNYPHWNPKMNWEPRPVYVVEVTPKMAEYPYSKQMFYIDAETFLLPYKEAYDKKGDLWKVVIIGFNDSPDMDELPPELGTCVAIDLQAEHATAFPWFENKVNVDLDPADFTTAALRKRSR